MKLLLLPFAVCLAITANAQIVGPDTVCVGVSTQFTTPQDAISYTWALDNVNIVQTPGAQSVVVSNPGVFGAMTYMTLNNDNGHYYSFATNYYQNKIIKVDYGNSPLNVPTLTDMGTFGLSTGMTDGLDVVRDASGNWYGIIVGGTQMLRLSFGNSLANAPIPTLWTYPANLLWPHQFIMKKDGTNWMGFAANRNGSVSRFDFGTSLNNTPTGVNLPATGFSNPSNLSLYKQNNTWYMLVINLTGGQFTRLNMGASLQNNNPTATTFPAGLNLPRGTSILTDCDAQLISYTLTEGGVLNRFDYAGDINTNPAATIVNNYPSGSLYNSTTPFTFNGVLYYLAAHTNGTIYRYTALTYPPQTTTKYYDPAFTHTFTTPGIYNLTLHCDQGFPQGPSAYCKTVVVVNSMSAVALGNDTTVCETSYTINSNVINGTSYLWSNGATTPTITVTSSGTYWLTATGPCVSGSDTINVTFQPKPVVALGPDTTICAGQILPLQSQGTYTSPTYLWNTGSNSSSININQAGTYWLQVTQGICSAKDTINITVLNLPTVSLGNDTTICAASYTLSPIAQNGNTYLWSTGATTPSINITASGTYWVQLSGPCGIVRDTITVSLVPALFATIGPDTSICGGQSIALQAQGNYVTPTFLWSTGSNGSTINVNQSGIYWVQVTQGPCITSDSVTVDVVAPPVVDLGNDKAYCEGSSTQLQSSNSYINATYLWNTGSTGISINVSQSGTYWLTVSTLPGCYGSDTVNVSEIPNPVVTISNDTSICPGTEVLIQSLSNFTNPAYLWSNGANTSGIFVSQPGLYWLMVTENGCSGTDSVNIIALPLPQVNISYTDSICESSTIILSSPQPDNSQYVWSTGSTEPSINVATGEYWLQVTNEYNCSAADTADIHYYESPYVTLPPDTTICNGDVLNVYPVSYYGSIMWSNNSSAIAIPITQEGTYYITVSTVCTSATDSIYINVEDCEIWLPNAFTPNGDGKNDIFRLLGNVGMVADLNFIIYNRFGECVFETNDATIGWDGFYRNTIQDVGTFGYYVKCTIGSRNIKMKGFLHLIK